MKKVIKSAFKSFNKRFGKNVDIMIIDDIFPQPLSSFRMVEFSAYLRTWPRLIIQSTATAFPLVNEHRSFEVVKQEFERNNPDLAGRVFHLNYYRIIRPKLAYFIFLHNTYNFLPYLEQHAIPFAFTLYPGGGFALNQEVSDNKLKRICNSVLFKQVIVSQNITRDYLLQKGFCLPSQITLIYGVVMPTDKLILAKELNGYSDTHAKDTFDICFVAHKYTPRGVDKGYDTFIEVAHALAADFPQIRFHVVGNFTPEDVDVTGLVNIKFYGTQQSDFFAIFYPTMDIILSPNVSFRLQPGAFDGFPTGSCVEAGLYGVALMCTDELKQNIFLKEGTDIIIITNNVDDIISKITYYYQHLSKLKQLAQTGQARLQELFSTQAQLQPRIQLLQKLLE